LNATLGAPKPLAASESVVLEARGARSITVVALPDYGVGVLTFVGQPTDGQTVTIGDTVYEFESGALAGNDVDIKGTLALSIAALADAINGTGTPGTDYASGLAANADVTAVAGATTLTVTARTRGTTFAEALALDTDVTDAAWDDTALTPGDSAAYSLSRVDSLDATSDGDATTTNSESDIAADTYAIDWPFYRLAVASGSIKYALTAF
jgi:hypothetical protein